MSDEQQMSEKDFIAANFFTPENEMPKKRKRKSRVVPADIRALRQFTRAADGMTKPQIRAAVNWLIAAYLRDEA